MGRAVAQLSASLSRSEEAQLHGREALATVTDAWALHRRAAADTEAESMASAVRHGEVARARLISSMVTLRACDESVRGYIEKIAPGSVSPVDGQEAAYPDGAALLEPPRPRNARAARNFVLREADRSREALSAVNEGAHHAVSFTRPPPPTGQYTSQPAPGPAFRPQHPAGAGDPVQTITLLVVVTVKAAESVLSNVVSKMRRSKE